MADSRDEGTRGKKEKAKLGSSESIQTSSLMDTISGIPAALKKKSDSLFQSIEQTFAKPLAKFRNRNTPEAVYYDYAQHTLKKLDSLFAQEQDRIKKWHSASAFYFLTGSEKSRESILKDYQKKVEAGLDGLTEVLNKLRAPAAPLKEEYDKLREALEARIENFEALHRFLKTAQEKGAPLQLTDPSLFTVSCRGYEDLQEMSREAQAIVAQKPGGSDASVGVLSKKPSMAAQTGMGGDGNQSYRIYTVESGEASLRPDEPAGTPKAHFYETRGEGVDTKQQATFRMQFAKDLPEHSDANRKDLRIATAMTMAANMLARLDEKPSKSKPLYLLGKNPADMVLLYTCLEYTMRQIGLSPKDCIQGDIEFKKMQKQLDAFRSNDIKKAHREYQNHIQDNYGFGGGKAPAAYAAQKAAELYEGTQALDKHLASTKQDIKTKLGKLKGSEVSSKESLLEPVDPSKPSSSSS